MPSAVEAHNQQVVNVPAEAGERERERWRALEDLGIREGSGEHHAVAEHRRLRRRKSVYWRQECYLKRAGIVEQGDILRAASKAATLF
jgi:hypothetical protein